MPALVVLVEQNPQQPQRENHSRYSFSDQFSDEHRKKARGGFLMRRLETVRGEFSLTALAYNIRRAATLAGIPELIAAVRP